jgi:DNA-binding GntR family transcriptional regulator
MQKISESIIALERASLTDQLFFHIKKMILSQELKCGECISEDGIAKIFGVSRTPIRETLRKLEKYGLVKINPRSQATVVEIGPEEAQYIGEVRGVLETLAAANLARKSTLEDIESLKKIARDCVLVTESGSLGEAYEKDGLFHLEIAKRSGNPYIYTILKNLEAKIQLIRIMNCGDINILLSDIPIHFQIIEAIEHHNSKNASALMRKHIGNFVNHASLSKRVEKAPLPLKSGYRA